MKKRHPPVQPIVFPFMCLMLAGFLAGLGYVLDQWTSIPWWIAAVLSPLVLILLPIEIRHVLRRRRICRHIREDFLDEEIGLTVDYAAMLSQIHAAPSPSRRARASILNTTGPSTWPTTA